MSKRERDAGPPAAKAGPDKTVMALAVAGMVALGLSAVANWWPSGASTGTASTANAQGSAGSAPTANAPVVGAATASPGRTQWAASATGRIEPREGEQRLAPGLPGRVIEVLAKSNARVARGDLLVRLDDEDALLKVYAANAEADVRRRERDEEPATGVALDRRNAEDALAEAERNLFRARQTFDGLGRAGKSTSEDMATARARIAAAEERLQLSRQALNLLMSRAGVPLPTRLESGLQVARTEVAAAEAAVEKLRVRAPADGSVLNVLAKIGEYAGPSPEYGLVTFGDLSSLRVRAEVEERDATKVRVGQKVVVRADAYPGRDFEGEVTSVAQALAAPRLAARGPRRPNDVEVIEVLATLAPQTPLLTGMRVDVFFRLEGTAEAPAAAAAK